MDEEDTGVVADDENGLDIPVDEKKRNNSVGGIQDTDNLSILTSGINNGDGSGDSPRNLIGIPYFCLICHCENMYYPKESKISMKSDPEISKAVTASEDGGIMLPGCGHIFCRECLISFFRSEFSEARVYPRCFHLVMESDGKTNKALVKDTKENNAIEASDGYEDNTGVIDEIQNENNVLENVSATPQPKSHQGFSNEVKEQTCNIPIPDAFIRSFLNEEIEKCENNQVNTNPTALSAAHGTSSSAVREELMLILEKYKGFKFMKENPGARECANSGCGHVQVHELRWGDAQCDGGADTPATSNLDIESNGNLNLNVDIDPKATVSSSWNRNRMICEKCGEIYCFVHGGAHRGKTCQEYEEAIAIEVAATNEAISKLAKECPGCKAMVEKSGGCNHMKCSQCGAAFCWVCGVQIEDDTFPAHFQWWNPVGCVNMQMNESIRPSATTILFGRIMSFFQCLFFGPPSCGTTVCSTILFFPCVCFPPSQFCCGMLPEKTAEKDISANRKQMLSSCMTIWGIFYMFLMFVVPLSVVGFFGFLVLGGLFYYPCYAAKRIANRRAPWNHRVSWFCARLCHPCIVCIRLLGMERDEGEAMQRQKTEIILDFDAESGDAIGSEFGGECQFEVKRKAESENEATAIIEFASESEPGQVLASTAISNTIPIERDIELGNTCECAKHTLNEPGPGVRSTSLSNVVTDSSGTIDRCIGDIVRNTSPVARPNSAPVDGAIGSVLGELYGTTSQSTPANVGENLLNAAWRLNAVFNGNPHLSRQTSLSSVVSNTGDLHLSRETSKNST